VGCIERGDQQEALIDLLTDELAEQGPDCVGSVECQSVEFGGVSFE
jgi:hypothetical protein